LALPGWLALTAMVRITAVAAGLPFASVTLAPVPAALAAGSATMLIVTVVLGARRVRFPRRPRSQPMPPERATTRRPTSRPDPLLRLARLALALAVAGAALAIVHRPDGATRLVVLDVGQGDAVLLEGARGGRLLV